MIIKKMVKCVTCDRCDLSYLKIAPRFLLKTILKRDGWKVTGNNVICPDCIAKEEE